LVERDTAFAYGAAESSYRPGEFDEFRADYRFTGKEDDVEVGLIYFGARYYAPLLQRWISADPLAVHSPGSADLNLFAYVHGRVFAAVDPVGLDGGIANNPFPIVQDSDQRPDGGGNAGFWVSVPISRADGGTVQTSFHSTFEQAWATAQNIRNAVVYRWTGGGGGGGSSASSSGTGGVGGAGGDPGYGPGPELPEKTGGFVGGGGAGQIPCDGRGCNPAFDALHDRVGLEVVIQVAMALATHGAGNALRALGWLRPAAPATEVAVGGVTQTARMVAPSGGTQVAETAVAAGATQSVTRTVVTETVVPQAVRGGSAAVAVENGAAESVGTLSTSARRAIRSTQKRLAEHEAKLAAYRENPFAFDNEGHLARNAGNAAVQNRVIQERIQHLEHEIANFHKSIAEFRSGARRP